MFRILVFFLGEWSVWREGECSRAEAEASLAFWRQRLSWPLKLEECNETA